MLRWIYRIKDPEPGLPVQVTDGLPQVGFRTLVWAIGLAFVLAFGLHLGLKLLTEYTAFDRRLLESFPPQVRNALVGGSENQNASARGDQAKGTTQGDELNSVINGKLRALILETPLHAEVPPLILQDAPDKPRYTKPAPSVKDDRADFFFWLPPFMATYFSSDVSAVQTYLYFISDCQEDLQTCQHSLLAASYKVVTELKHNPSFILYRLQSGFIQLIATYVFAIGILVLVLRERRAALIRKPLETSGAGKKYAKDCGWPVSLPSLSVKETLETFWDKTDLTKDPCVEDVRAQLKSFRAVYYEPAWVTEVGKGTHLGRADLLRLFHTHLADSLKWSVKDNRTTATERFLTVLPRTILKVAATYAVNRRYSPESACERSGEALDYAVDEIAAAIAADRDLYSRLVELTPVVGFFGTVVGLSLAMLGANDVIRAQGQSWNYWISNNDTYITLALQDPSEKQQFALQGMLGALSIKFDTTGWALILMFVLIVLGARVQRREYRTLSFVHSVVSESLLSVLPSIGGGLWLSRGLVSVPSSGQTRKIGGQPSADDGDLAERAAAPPGDPTKDEVAMAAHR